MNRTRDERRELPQAIEVNMQPNYYYKCPLCGEVSDLVPNPEQAFCKSESCPVLTFNPSLPDGGLSNVHEIQWEEPALKPFTTCPECYGMEFLEGPHGGLAVNFCCAHCFARFNDPIAFPIQRDGFVAEQDRHFFHGPYVPKAWIEV